MSVVETVKVDFGDAISSAGMEEYFEGSISSEQFDRWSQQGGRSFRQNIIKLEKSKVGHTLTQTDRWMVWKSADYQVLEDVCVFNLVKR